MMAGKKNKAEPDERAKLFDALADWGPSPEDAGKVRVLADRSLTEVTRLTEYQDEKANRILTAMAFLSAFAGTLMLGFLNLVAPGTDAATKHWAWPWCFGLVIAYSVALVAGSAVVVWAIRPRFNVPPAWRSNERPASFLFFAKILDVSPEAWAGAFTEGEAHSTLEADYAKNAILETYLIAQKLRVKIRYLWWGIGLLWLSTVLLGVWIVAAAALIVVTR